MRTLWAKFWGDDSGCVAATEWMVVASILTLGVLMATLALHQADELEEKSERSIGFKIPPSTAADSRQLCVRPGLRTVPLQDEPHALSKWLVPNRLESCGGSRS